MSLEDKEILDKTRRRKLLAIDGGGIRGIIAIEVLAEIENLGVAGSRYDLYFHS